MFLKTHYPLCSPPLKSLPYFVDVVIYEHITNEALREHIDRVGISIYKS